MALSETFPLASHREKVLIPRIAEVPWEPGGQWFDKWGYACRPADDPAEHYQALGGAVLICFSDEDDFAA